MQSNSSVLALFSPQPAVEPTASKADYGSDSDFNDFLSNAKEQVDKTHKSNPGDSANNNNESEVGKTTKPKLKNNTEKPETDDEKYQDAQKQPIHDEIVRVEAEIEKITKQIVDKEIEKKMATAKMKPFKDKLNKLNKPLKAYQSEIAEFLKETKQRIGDWKKLLEWFPENKYEDVEGLCKITDLEEIEENDYSLTPRRYVGYSIQFDEDFDYQTRIKDIHSELAVLNTESSDLMNQIQSVEL